MACYMDKLLRKRWKNRECSLRPIHSVSTKICIPAKPAFSILLLAICFAIAYLFAFCMMAFWRSHRMPLIFTEKHGWFSPLIKGTIDRRVKSFFSLELKSTHDAVPKQYYFSPYCHFENELLQASRLYDSQGHVATKPVV